MSYAFRTDTINYRLGGGITFGEKSNLTFSTQIHRLTSARDRDLLLSYSEQFLRAFVDADFQDYYTRQGGVMALQWQHASLKHTLGLSLLLEEHESIRDDSDSFLRIGNSNYHLNTHARMNSPIYDGRMHSISLKYDFDTRENTGVIYDLGNRGDTNEWYNTFLVEHSNTAMESDFDFTRFVVHLRNYHPIGDDQIDTRLKVGLASTQYMLPFQRQFVLGGIGTLRGYSLYEFVGNHGFLFNMEYAHSVANGIYIVPFVDIGQAWDNLADIKDIYPKANLGIGFQFGIFRLNLARALEKDRGYQANFKWSRTF
ncbi:BamA/TamA family outer membrane protein [Candidatus Poribacteria bacterium]|nr:BamA/TamA family outer membrane protein [Candidatus Poribacteria bacterium]